MKVENFKNCHFNPLEKDFSTKAVTLTGITDNLALIKFVICMYDPQSPMRNSYPEMGQRRTQSAKLTGHTATDEVDQEEAVVALGYLKVIKSRVWNTIVSLENTHWQYTKMLMEPVNAGDNPTVKERRELSNYRNEIATLLVSINSDLEDMYNKFYGDKSLQSAVDDLTVSLTPEKLAELLSVA